MLRRSSEGAQHTLIVLTEKGPINVYCVDVIQGIPFCSVCEFAEALAAATI